MNQNRVKLIEVYGRKAGWSREQFFAYQRGRHMEVTALVPEFCGKIRGACQNTILLSDELENWDPIRVFCTHDGKDTIVELYFDTADHALEAFHEPRYLELVRPDEESFSDVENGWSMLTEEEVLCDSGVEGHRKLFLFLKLGKDNAEARHNLQHKIKNIPGMEKSVKITENRALSGTQLENAGDFDVMLTFWFQSLEDLEYVIQDGGMQDFLTQSEIVRKNSVIVYCAKDN